MKFQESCIQADFSYQAEFKGISVPGNPRFPGGIINYSNSLWDKRHSAGFGPEELVELPVIEMISLS